MRTRTWTDAWPGAWPDVLGPAPQRALIGAALAAHLAGGWALWQARDEPSAPASLALLQVDWIEPLPARAAPSRPDPQTRPEPRPEPRAQTPPTRPAVAPNRPVQAPPPVLAAASPEPAALPLAPVAPVSVRVAVPEAVAATAVPSTAEASTEAAPAPSPAPSTAPAAAPATSTHATTAAAPAPPAAPRPVTLSATDWVRPPVYAYPREAVRRREQGVVALRILFDTQGVPRRVSLLRSSGSATLDEEALAKARAARARPRLQDGVPVEFLADTEAEFKV